MLKKILLNSLFFIFIFLFTTGISYGLNVSGTLSSDETWDLSNSPYVVTGNLTINSGVTLTIDPGVEVKFSGAYKITVQGTLSAQGTSGSNIIFTSGNASPSPGNWRGIYFNGGGGIIEYAQVLYGGYNATQGGVTFKNSTGIIRNSTVENSKGSGIVVYSGTPTIQNNIVSGTSGGGGKRGLYIRSGTPTITGNEIRDNEGQGLYVYSEGGTISGNTITSNGEDGIYIRSGVPDIQSNTITNNTGYGILTKNLEHRLYSYDIYGSNTYSGNTGGQYATEEFDIDSTSGTIDGVTYPIHIISGGTLGSGYEITLTAGSIVKINGNRTITISGVLNSIGTSGNNIIFTTVNDHSVSGLLEYGSGTPTPGDWNGITISGGGSDSTIIEYTKISYAGHTSDRGGIKFTNSAGIIRNSILENSKGSGIVANSGNPTIENNLVTGSFGGGGRGIYINSGTPTITGNQINSNEGEGLYFYDGLGTITGNTITSNGSDGIYIRSGVPDIQSNTITNNTGYGILTKNLEHRLYSYDIYGSNTYSGNSLGLYATEEFDIDSTSGTIDGVTYPIHIISGGTLGSGYEITLTAGSIVKINGNKTIKVYGVLNSTGTSGNNIIFTTINDHSVSGLLGYGTGTPVQGDRNGITISGGGSDSTIIEYTQIKYAGYNSSNGSLIFSNSSGTIRNSLIDDNKGPGVYTSGGNPTIESNLISGSIGGSGGRGIYINSGTPTITGNEIRDNEGQGLYINDGGGTISGNTITSNGEDGIYIKSGTPNIQSNTITNNTGYGILTKNLEHRLYSYDILGGNTYSGNTGGRYATENFDIDSTSGTIDGVTYPIHIISGGTLNNSSELTLTAGTIVKVNGDRTITIAGVLKSIGTSSDNIIFTTVNDHSVIGLLGYGTGTPTSGDWNGLYLNGSGSDGSIIEYTQIYYGGYNADKGGVTFRNSGGIIRNSFVYNSKSVGIVVNGGSPIMQNNLVSNTISTGRGISISSGMPTITGNEIRDNEGPGLYVDDGGTISGNTITSNGEDGIYIKSGTPDIQSNTITNNTGYGILTKNLEHRLYSYDILGLNTYSGNTGGWYATEEFDIDSPNGTIDGLTYPIHIISGGTLGSGYEITLTAGTIVKINGDRAIEVKGLLNSIGTSGNNIIFTTINDHSVSGLLGYGTGTPSSGDRKGIYFNGSSSDASILEYTQVYYGGYNADRGGVTFRNSSGIIRNSFVSNSQTCGIVIYGGNPTIQNNVISLTAGTGRGVYIKTGEGIINSNILYNNLGNGVYNNSGTPVVKYNLYYGNSSTYNGTMDGGSIVGLDPLFVSNTIELQGGSPAINAGDPSLGGGSHSISGDRYDMGAREYTGYRVVSYQVDISGVGGRELTYQWSFDSEPTGGSAPPSLSNESGTISTSQVLTTSFELRKLGSYQLSITVKDSSLDTIGTGYTSFSVTN